MQHKQWFSWLVIFSYVLTGWLGHGLHHHGHEHGNHYCENHSSLTKNDHNHHIKCCHAHVHQAIQHSDVPESNLPVANLPVGSEEPQPSQHPVHEDDHCHICDVLFSVPTLNFTLNCEIQMTVLSVVKPQHYSAISLEAEEYYDSRGPPIT